MKMFILGAVCFYLVTSLIGFILDHFEILDSWDFGEYYVNGPILPFACIYGIFKRFHDHWDYYKLIIKYGMFFKKYECLRELDTKKLRAIQKTKCGWAVRHFIDEIMEERGEKTYNEYAKME